MDRLKHNRLMYELYLRAFRGNWHEMANVVSRLRSENRANGGDGAFHMGDLDKYLNDKPAPADAGKEGKGE